MVSRYNIINKTKENAMILRVNYVIEETGKMKIAEIKNCRIKTTEDRHKIERIIEKQLGYKKVHIFNWRIIGTISDKIGEGE